MVWIVEYEYLDHLAGWVFYRHAYTSKRNAEKSYLKAINQEYYFETRNALMYPVNLN